MIFYFTGTGNSLYVAKELDEKIISIPQIIKEKRLEFSADSIGIVCPVYGHEMPGMVKEFIRRASFETDYLFAVLTYGAHHGGVAEIAGLFSGMRGKRRIILQPLRWWIIFFRHLIWKDRWRWISRWKSI